jgi:plastocyanin
MADIKIKIEVKPNGDLVYDPAVHRATEGDRITWYSNADWAVLFTGGTPLTSVSFSGHAGPPEKATFGKNSVVRAGAQGIYHYAVAVANSKGVFLDAGCPTIIIN